MAIGASSTGVSSPLNEGRESQPLLCALSRTGYAHLSDVSARHLETLLASLGTVIQTTDIRIKERSKALVTSSKGLSFHTDHHKADIVAWHCLRQSSKGGDSVFVDTECALREFTEDEKRTLSQIQLREHKVFSDDRDSHPLLVRKGDRYRCYYSFWLVNKDLGELERSLMDRFERAISQVQLNRIRLEAGDLLLIDNGRMLHGRTAIEGDKDRFLKRFWISNPEFPH